MNGQERFTMLQLKENVSRLEEQNRRVWSALHALAKANGQRLDFVPTQPAHFEVVPAKVWV